jgi:hypothetical protein
MARCLALSLRRHGGACRDAPIILTAADERIDAGLAGRNPWLGELGIELRWAPAELYRAYSHMAPGLARFSYAYRAEMVLFLDADLLIAGPFDEVVLSPARSRGFAGMIAPASPLQFYPRPVTWEMLYQHCGIAKAPDCRHEHPGWPLYCSPNPAFRFCPSYFNYGVVCASAGVMKQIAELYWPLVLKLHELHRMDLNAQIALGMAVDQLGLPVHALPVRYNFPNHPLMEARHPDELPHARVLHMKEDHQGHKFGVYSSIEGILAFARRTDLTGINARAGDVLRSIERDLMDGPPTRAAA